jgi:hypothetical protein
MEEVVEEEEMEEEMEMEMEKEGFELFAPAKLYHLSHTSSPKNVTQPQFQILFLFLFLLLYYCCSGGYMDKTSPLSSLPTPSQILMFNIFPEFIGQRHSW